MSAFSNTVPDITLFVDDLPRARAFYMNTFDIKPIFEDANSAAFKFQYMMVNLLKSPAAHELIAPAVVGSAGAGRRFHLTIWAPDVDAAAAELEARGVQLLNGPIDRALGLRTVAFEDPDGHIWEIAQEMG